MSPRSALLVVLVARHSPTRSLDQPRTLSAGRLAGTSRRGTGPSVDTAADQTWPWHQDASELAATNPDKIKHLDVRAQGQAAAFSFGLVEARMASIPTDDAMAGNGTTGGHDPTFAGNLGPDEIVVRVTGTGSGPAGSQVRFHTSLRTGIDVLRVTSTGSSRGSTAQ